MLKVFWLFWLSQAPQPLLVSAAAILWFSLGMLSQIRSVDAQETPAERTLMLEQIEQYNPLNLSQQQSEPLERVNFVNDLSDVRPTDWAFQALLSLTERYGCLLAYPDGTYRGNRAITRYQFAAGLNECMEQIQILIQEASTELDAEDLAQLQRLQADFAGELATLRRDVDAIEGTVTSLETDRFSTTTKLQGEASFFLTGAIGETKADGSGSELEENTVFQYRSRLILNTSFTGRDLLKTFLVTGNSTPLGANVTGTNMTRLAFDLNTNGDVRHGKMFYRFPLGENLNINIDALGGGFNANMPTFNEFFTPEIKGALSPFGRFNPIYRQGLGGSGATVNYNLSDAFNLSLGYLAPNAQQPIPGKGLFNGSFAGLGQLAIKPTNNLRFGLTYVHSYHPGNRVFLSGQTGSTLANQPFGQTATSANHFGFQTSFAVNSNLTLGGWAGLTLAQAEAAGIGVNKGDEATIFNWAVTLAASNLDSRGSRAGIVVGQPPKVTSSDSGSEEEDTAWHFESFYRYQLSNKIGIEPGFLVIVNPEHNADNDSIWMGNIRTIFLF